MNNNLCWKVFNYEYKTVKELINIWFNNIKVVEFDHFKHLLSHQDSNLDEQVQNL